MTTVVSRLLCLAVLAACAAPARAAEPPGPLPAGFALPTVPAEHRHARSLLASALRYADPANKTTDPVSGYPFEGWNHDPAKGTFLRSFTQLTAIGLWMELLAHVAAGHADTPYLSREKALTELTRVVQTLRLDQRDPKLAAKGLLVNFLDLGSGKRLGPLAADMDRQWFLDELGPEKGAAVWKALVARGWLVPQNGGREAAVHRGDGYGWNHFTGPLAPYQDDVTRTKVMSLLDRRVIPLVFGDNANLSASAARTVGALLDPAVKDNPSAVAVRQELERFLDDQREGYARLYDPKAGLFYFGWDATRDRPFGWEDQTGKWKTGHQDYLVNEFRGPAAFVVLRFGLPVDAVADLGFKMKTYPLHNGREVFALAPWEGSAFQALGLTVWPGELADPVWRSLLETAVDAQIDFATRHKLPGFLSESYTGDGNRYTGAVGLPALAVSPAPRVTDAASLYTLGPAYTVAPAKVEAFLAAHWPTISTLLTDHGPWEGFNTTRGKPIEFQTTAHTLSLTLGLLRTGPDAMTRYLASRRLGDALAALHRPGAPLDLLADGTDAFAWAEKSAETRTTREKGEFRVRGERVGHPGVAFVPAGGKGVSLSGGVLTLRYRNVGPGGPATLALKPAPPPSPDAGRIATEVYFRLAETGEREAEVRIPLPATPGLTRVREVVLTADRGAAGSLDLTITHLAFAPAPRAGAAGQ